MHCCSWNNDPCAEGRVIEVWHPSRGVTSHLQVCFLVMCCHSICWNIWEKSHCFLHGTQVSCLLNRSPTPLSTQTPETLWWAVGVWVWVLFLVTAGNDESLFFFLIDSESLPSFRKSHHKKSNKKKCLFTCCKQRQAIKHLHGDCFL